MDGKDGKNGKDGKSVRGEKGKDGKEGSPDEPQDIATKLNTLREVIDIHVIKGALQKSDLEFNNKKILDGMAVVDKRIKAIDMRWHGAGLSQVSHDATLTGLGTSSSPLSAVSGGTWYQDEVVVSASGGFPFTTATTYSTTTNATTTPLWLQGNKFSLFASSTSVIDYASTTALSSSNLTSGNCLQASTGGLIIDTGSVCKSGTVTAVTLTWQILSSGGDTPNIKWVVLPTTLSSICSGLES